MPSDEWNAEAVKKMVLEGMKAGLKISAEAIKGEAKDSCPIDTNRLRGSIGYRVTPIGGGYQAKIGTNVEYAEAVEMGTSKTTVITPKNGKFLSWIDKNTGKRVFARKVTIPPHAGKPYLLPAFDRWKDRYKLVIAQQIRARIGDGHH